MHIIVSLSLSDYIIKRLLLWNTWLSLWRFWLVPCVFIIVTVQNPHFFSFPILLCMRIKVSLSLRWYYQTSYYQTSLTLKHTGLSRKIFVNSLCIYYSYCIESSLHQFSHSLMLLCMHIIVSLSLSLSQIILSNGSLCEDFG